MVQKSKCSSDGWKKGSRDVFFGQTKGVGVGIVVSSGSRNGKNKEKILFSFCSVCKFRIEFEPSFTLFSGIKIRIDPLDRYYYGVLSSYQLTMYSEYVCISTLQNS